jgi:hypothetical protein
VHPRNKDTGIKMYKLCNMFGYKQSGRVLRERQDAKAAHAAARQ